MNDNGQSRSASLILSEQVQHRLRRAYQRASAIFCETVGETSVTPAQWAALTTLRIEGGLSQNLLGRRTSMDPATIQGVIVRLEERALVDRTPDPQDRRRTIVRLSDNGRELVDSLAPKALDAHCRTLEPLTPEEKTLFLSLLARLA
jgi:DNA-binding MarR family transcriptional regulator